MALREILKKDEELLRKKSRPVEKFDDRLITLLEDMKDTLHEARGCGLAAPQIGILRRIVVIEVPEDETDENSKDLYFEIINPMYLKKEGEQKEYEGCLSCPGEFGITTRPEYVKIEAYDRFGKKFTLEGRGLLARAICHELDHLDGVLFIDHAEMVETEE